jgi:hypothetical protein
LVSAFLNFGAVGRFETAKFANCQNWMIAIISDDRNRKTFEYYLLERVAAIGVHFAVGWNNQDGIAQGSFESGNSESWISCNDGCLGPHICTMENVTSLYCKQTLPKLPWIDSIL